MLKYCFFSLDRSEKPFAFEPVLSLINNGELAELEEYIEYVENVL